MLNNIGGGGGGGKGGGGVFFNVNVDHVDRRVLRISPKS